MVNGVPAYPPPEETGIAGKKKQIPAQAASAFNKDNPDLATTVTLLTQTHFLCEPGARGGIVRRDHRVFRRQAPFFAVLLRRHIVLRPQMTLQRLEFLAVYETDQEVA